MDRKKTRAWHWLLTASLAVGILLVVFWDLLGIYVAPNTMLTQAVTKAVSRLEERFNSNPLRMVIQTLDPDGKQTADVEIKTQHHLLGEINYDFALQTDHNRVYTQGSASVSDQKLDVSLFLNGDFMAVSSAELTNNIFYGITYDTFSEDIHRIPLLKWFVSESLFSRWEGAVLRIRDQMRRSDFRSPLPQLSEKEWNMLLAALLAMPSDMERSAAFIDSKETDCHKITYRISGTQVAEVLKQYLGYDRQQIAVTASFYLFEEALVMIDMVLKTESETIHARFTLGTDPAEDPLKIVWSTEAEGKTDHYAVCVNTRRTENTYGEDWLFRHGTDETAIDFLVSYVWNPKTGNMALTDGDGDVISLCLTETDTGFRLQTAQFKALCSIFAGSDLFDSPKEAECTMSVRKGSDFVTPTYKNPDQWTIEDLVMLLEGFGALMGLKKT